MAIKPSYAAIADQKKEQREDRIPKQWRLPKGFKPGEHVLDVPNTCGILTAREIEITGETDAVDILQKIRNRMYTSEETVRAFCKRAAIAQQASNCLTEILFEEAIDRAKTLDIEQAADSDVPLRPLHGLPVSLKDCFRVPGYDSTTGIMCWANAPDSEYSALPQLLLDLGAVLFCKTNVPQTMMTADTDNNLFGRTLNPANASLTAGGSSGGEGALIAMRGSILGVGTDIAGSIRIPSVCNGIYGFRPSASLLPYGGQRSPAPAGLPGIQPVVGPMATSLRACEIFMKTIIEAQPWKYDSTCLHVPWRNIIPTKRLRVGLIPDDGLFTPWPPVRRTILESASKLERAGVEIVHLRLPEIPKALETTFRLYALDGCRYVQDLLERTGEPLVESVKRVNLAGIPHASLEEYREMATFRAHIQRTYQKIWLDNELDAFLLPGASTTATPLDEWGPVTYTALWNFVGYPAMILPTGMIRPSDGADELENAKYGKHDQNNYSLYTGPEDFARAPLCIQVVGMRQEDEQLLSVAAIIDKILRD
ncbi:Putative amidase [Septoria linicola]|uniref:amidase n=1 Tax=Septoria linicola TaxID=215465 RepID=A0A9Q9EMX7_9PEZI|nr:Putative amidase [Septoria linicola]